MPLCPATTSQLPSSTHLRPAALHQVNIRLKPLELRCVFAWQLVSRRHLWPPAVRHKADQLRRLMGRRGRVLQVL